MDRLHDLLSDGLGRCISALSSVRTLVIRQDIPDVLGLIHAEVTGKSKLLELSQQSCKLEFPRSREL